MSVFTGRVEQYTDLQLYDALASLDEHPELKRIGLTGLSFLDSFGSYQKHADLETREMIRREAKYCWPSESFFVEFHGDALSAYRRTEPDPGTFASDLWNEMGNRAALGFFFAHLRLLTSELDDASKVKIIHILASHSQTTRATNLKKEDWQSFIELITNLVREGQIPAVRGAAFVDYCERAARGDLMPFPGDDR